MATRRILYSNHLLQLSKAAYTPATRGRFRLMAIDAQRRDEIEDYGNGW